MAGSGSTGGGGGVAAAAVLLPVAGGHRQGFLRRYNAPRNFPASDAAALKGGRKEGGEARGRGVKKLGPGGGA